MSRIYEELTTLETKLNAFAAVVEEHERQAAHEQELARKAAAKRGELLGRRNLMRALKFILEGVEARALQLRSDHATWLWVSTDDKSTLGDARQARDRAASVLEELRRTCQHRFVLWRQAYAGSDSHDYDDWVQGRRTCAVCGFQEYNDNDDYTHLSEFRCDQRLRLVTTAVAGLANGAAYLDDPIAPFWTRELGALADELGVGR